MKKTVSLVDVNFQQGPKKFNAHYLPYSVGILWSYAHQFPEIADHYDLGQMLWRRDSIDAAVEKLETADVVGFSCHVWNRNYSYTLARRLKELHPHIKILFGGPEPAIGEPEFFRKWPFIDIMVKHEGEISFKRVLESFLTGSDPGRIPGLLVNRRGRLLDTGNPLRIDDLDDIPSPYLMGYFDRILQANPDVTWNTTLETNRGCPYRCTFCDWGSLTHNKVKKFDLERVLAELEWIGRNRCGFLNIADANFGLFPDRDQAIAQRLVEVQARYGYPNSYTISWAKNQRPAVIDIVKTLISGGTGRVGLNLSVQSLNDVTLRAVKRRNLAINEISEVFRMCEREGIPLYTELILGLPGETLDTWKENFWKLFKAGNHTGITVYQAQLLENAEMNLTQRAEYGLEAVTVYDYLDGANNLDGLREGVKVVVATSAMPRDIMLEAMLFSWLMNTFHISGITTFLCRFLFDRYGIEYSTFYERLHAYIQRDAFLARELADTRHYFSKWMREGEIQHPRIAGVDIFGVNLIHRTVINIHARGQSAHVFDVIEDFLHDAFAPIDPGLIKQLVTFQRHYLVNHAELSGYPRVVGFDYDFLGYMRDGTALEKPAVYTFEFAEDKKMSLTTFCEQIFFARRKNFGKATVTGGRVA